MAAAFGDEDRAAEIAQRVWLRFLRRSSAESGWSPDPGVIYISAQNVARDIVRYQKRHPADSWNSSAGGHEPEAPPEADPLEGEDLKAVIDAAVATLDGNQQACVRLWLLDTPTEEIARITGLKVSSVYASKCRGFGKLREILTARYPELAEHLVKSSGRATGVVPRPKQTRKPASPPPTSPAVPDEPDTGGACI